MRDLERALRVLGGELELPPAPDLAAAVGARLRAEAPSPAHRQPRALVLVFAAVAAAALAAALAVPQARSALLELLGLRGATVERVGTLPHAAAGGARLVPGERVTLAEARRAADFPVLSPRRECAAFVDRSVPGGMVSLVCPPQGTRRVVLTQFRGEQIPYVGKLVGPGTEAVAVSVGGAPGVWIEGAPHVLLFRDASGRVRERTRRLAGDVLLWERDGVTYRLEGALGGREGALRLARDLR